MVEKREIYKISNPYLWECETFYLTYNKKTNKLEFNGKELNDNSYNLDNVFVVWDGKDHNYYSAHPKQFIEIYRSNSDKPEEGYVFIGKEKHRELEYYYKRKESYSMLITKQYVVFGKNNVELEKQLDKIVQEFNCAGWKIRQTERGVQPQCVVVGKRNVNIYIESCIISNNTNIMWDNCWISNSIDREIIRDIIIPMAISDTPEIHFF